MKKEDYFKFICSYRLSYMIFNKILPIFRRICIDNDILLIIFTRSFLYILYNGH